MSTNTHPTPVGVPLRRDLARALPLPGDQPEAGYLVLVEGGATRRMALARPVTYIGRSTQADIQIDDPRVSRDHAVLTAHGGEVRLRDNGSANGTFVGGRRISTATLADGDTIQIGPLELRYVQAA